MRELARLAGGVHPSTVSLALRNSPSISGALRKRIQALAAQHGYRRDPWLDAFNNRRVSGLVHRVHPVIGWIVDVDSRGTLTSSPRHAERWRGALAAAAALHYQVEPFFVGENRLTVARLETILRARGIESLVFAGVQGDSPTLAWERYGAVKIDGLDWASPGYTVASDLRQGVRLAVGRAREKGARRIGLALNTARGRAWNDLLLAGYLIEHRAGSDGASIPPMVTEQCPGSRRLAEWIRAEGVDFILGDWVELGRCLREGRTSTTRRLPWACLDTTTSSGDVAGLILPHERVGWLAIEQAVTLARTNQKGGMANASTTLVPVGWRDGASPRPNE